MFNYANTISSRMEAFFISTKIFLKHIAIQKVVFFFSFLHIYIHLNLWRLCRVWYLMSIPFYRSSDFSKVPQIINVKVLVTQPCLTLCNPMDYSSPASFVDGILQARILEWVAIPFSRASSPSWDWIQVFHIAGRYFTIWTTREANKCDPSIQTEIPCYQISWSFHYTLPLCSCHYLKYVC